MAVIGELHGKPVEINLALLIINEFHLHGVQSASREDLKEILQFMHENRIESVIWKISRSNKRARPTANSRTAGSSAESCWCPERSDAIRTSP